MLLVRSVAATATVAHLAAGINDSNIFMDSMRRCQIRSSREEVSKGNLTFKTRWDDVESSKSAVNRIIVKSL